VQANENGGIAEAGIDWFLVAAAVTAIALPAQSAREKNTELLFARWAKENELA
jgi:hypothetical protein